MRNPKSNLPLIRLSSVNPFLLELARRNVDGRELLRRFGLPDVVPASSDLFASAVTVYEVVEECAIVADDPHLGFKVGRNIDFAEWEPIARALTDAETVGDLLQKFVVNSLDHSSATEFFVRTEGERTTFGFTRVVIPDFRPAQIDAFYLGLFAKLLMQATGPRWEHTDVLAKVAFLGAIPPLPGLPRLAQGDNTGMRISFPTAWQFSPLRKSAFATAVAPVVKEQVPETIVESVRAALRPHMHEANLTVDKAANICGFEKRSLARKLRAEGTTIIKEISSVRFEWAQDKLATSGMRIAEIGEAVGFTDPTVFSRAFKNWSGRSPMDYRRNHKS
ncbi:MAG: helix-turn-helix domain-containing protein [Woeseiaceae bacterium]